MFKIVYRVRGGLWLPLDNWAYGNGDTSGWLDAYDEMQELARQWREFPNDHIVEIGLEDQETLEIIDSEILQ